MKTFIAYALVVIRIPNFAGSLFGVIFTLPISLIVWLSRRGTETPLEAADAVAKEPTAWMFCGRAEMAVRDRFAHACHDVFSGLGSVLAAALLFHLLQVPLRLWVLFIMVVWEIIFTKSCGQSFRALFSSLAGMLVGWFVVLRLFSL